MAPRSTVNDTSSTARTTRRFRPRPTTNVFSTRSRWMCGALMAYEPKGMDARRPAGQPCDKGRRQPEAGGHRTRGHGWPRARNEDGSRAGAPVVADAEPPDQAGDHNHQGGDERRRVVQHRGRPERVVLAQDGDGREV